MTSYRNRMVVIATALVMSASMSLAASRAVNRVQLTLTEELVRKELLMIPYVGVFDNLAFKVEGDTVTLYGQVVRPVTKKEAERRVKKIEGVEKVVNEIVVLPNSSYDNRIRVTVFREISRTGGLYRYMQGGNPSIRIVVNNGHVTLEGMVANKTDSQLAYAAASTVPGIFRVINNLKIETR